jgi:hypothetical protein
MCLVQSMTCKDAINSDTTSEEEKLYLVSEVTRYNKCFRFNLEGTAINQLRVDLEFLFNSDNY